MDWYVLIELDMSKKLEWEEEQPKSIEQFTLKQNNIAAS
jgi:hypothetical protein